MKRKVLATIVLPVIIIALATVQVFLIIRDRDVVFESAEMTLKLQQEMIAEFELLRARVDLLEDSNAEH